MSDDELFLIHYYLKTKSFDEILNWTPIEKEFALVSAFLDLEQQKEEYKWAQKQLEQF